MGDQITINKDELDKALLKAQGELMEVMDKHEVLATKMQAEIDEAKSASVESQNENEALGKKYMELADRCVQLEQRGDDMITEAEESLGAQFVKSADYEAMIERGSGSARLELKTAIINVYPASSVQPLVQGDRLQGIHAVPNRRLTIKDILPVGTTSSNLVEFTRENAFTNAAAPQRDTDSPYAKCYRKRREG